MATLKSKTLFFTTSPRTPTKMIPEIKLLFDKFQGEKWDTSSQIRFMEFLSADQSFNGSGANDPAFSARDRINRAPKALGFVDLKPTIQITEAGSQFISGIRTEEILLRQLLKFQIPSPYHKEKEGEESIFFVKPYLEIFRLIYSLEKVSFDEVMIFGMQLTNYQKFDEVLGKILDFRANRIKYRGSYKEYLNIVFNNELQEIYKTEIKSGQTETRESNDDSLQKFLKTKQRNHHDYTDACFRYLRATGMVSLSQKGKSLSIMEEKKVEIEFILTSIEREPKHIDDEKEYKAYLFNAHIPVLFTDNKDNLKEFILKRNDFGEELLVEKTIDELKDIREFILETRRERIISEQVATLKSFSEESYRDVIATYESIINRDFYDLPLMLEWNTWRAMTMLNGGEIKGNFKLDDNGEPMSTAQGNRADIECDYGDFGAIVEVTLQSGQRQYESEGEPVARHLARYKDVLGKDAFCIFIAPTINEAAIAHFFMLSKTSISYYGGMSTIIPIELNAFIQMIKNTLDSGHLPSSNCIQELFEFSKSVAETAKDETQWYNALQDKAHNWLTA